jgi:hypothetical protein
LFLQASLQEPETVSGAEHPAKKKLVKATAAKKPTGAPFVCLFKTGFIAAVVVSALERAILPEDRLRRSNSASTPWVKNRIRVNMEKSLLPGFYHPTSDFFKKSSITKPKTLPPKGFLAGMGQYRRMLGD